MGCCCSSEKKSPVVEQNSPYKEDLLSEKEHEKVVRNVLLQSNTLPSSESNDENPEVTKATADSQLKVEPPENYLENELEPLSPKTIDSSAETISITPISTRSNVSSSLRRTSSSVTKEHREFRIFLPCINDSSDNWLTTEQKENYKNALTKLTSTLNNNDNNEEQEVRDDTYLISQSYFNLKYRDDQKLEMKVRTPNKPIWQEKWSKVKFGKKQMKHYRTDIITYLKDVGHEDEENADYIDNPRYLTVSKSRNLTAFEINRVSVEICYIDVSPTKYTPTKHTKQENFDDHIKRQKWISISIAGDSTAIEAFVVQYHENEKLWEALSLAQEYYIENKDVAFQHGFLPVVSGYSQWIRVMANKVSTTEGVAEEITRPVEAFLEFLKAEEEE